MGYLCSLYPQILLPPPVHLDAPGQRHGQQPVCRTADPEAVNRDKPSRGSVDATKTHSDPQRVRMSSGERPIGTTKGKQLDTEALCQPPPPPCMVTSRAAGVAALRATGLAQGLAVLSAGLAAGLAGG